MASNTWHTGIDRGMVSGELLWLGNYGSEDPCLDSWKQDFDPADIHVSAPFDEENLIATDVPGQVGVYVTKEAFDCYFGV